MIFRLKLSINNTCRHYYTKYSLEYFQLTESNSQRNLKLKGIPYYGRMSLWKRKKLKWGCKQSFQVAHLLAKQGKPLPMMSWLNYVWLEQPKQMCLEKNKLAKTIIILVRTDPWGIEDLRSSISTSQLGAKQVIMVFCGFWWMMLLGLLIVVIYSELIMNLNWLKN